MEIIRSSKIYDVCIVGSGAGGGMAAKVLAEAGAEVVPASPGFYHNPQTIDDLVDFVAGRILDRLGVENSLMRRWQGAPIAEMASLDD